MTVDAQAASDTATRLRRFATGEISAEAFQREEGAPLRDAVGALLDSHAALAARFEADETDMWALAHERDDLRRQLEAAETALELIAGGRENGVSLRAPRIRVIARAALSAGAADRQEPKS